MSDTSRRYPPELRERAVRMVLEHQHEYGSQWAATVSIGGRFGPSAETLRNWVRRAEVDGGFGPGVTSGERERLRPECCQGTAGRGYAVRLPSVR